MRRSALPSYAPDGRRAAPSTAATIATAGRWHTRRWLLFYAVLGFYALAVLGSFVWGWAPQQAQAEPQQEHQVLLQHQQKVVDAGPVKVEATDPNEGEMEEEMEMPRELEQQQQGQEGAAEDEIVAQEVTGFVAIEPATVTPSPTTTTPETTSPSTPEVQIVTEKNVEIPTRQNDVVLLVANEEETKQEEATGETKAPSQEGEVPNQAEVEIPAPQEQWEVENSAKDAGTPEPLATHVFPVGKDQPGDQAALVSGLRNSAADRDAWSVEGYQHEVERLESLKKEAKEETERLKLLIGATDKLIAEEKDRLEDKRAASTLDIRQHQPRKIRNNLKCVVRGTFKKQFCGMTMVQFDVDGNVLFLHRNAKKLEGKVDKMDRTYWTHLQSFKWEQEVAVGDAEEIAFPANRTAVQRLMSYEDMKKKYQIGIQPSGALFKEFESCYGAEANVIGNYNLTKFEDLPFANLEQELINYAHEGALLMARAQGRMGVQ
ncbi:hypothetical protein PF010_g5524 [Phytophthora fragariae]|uniref:Uncharacterized protein n=1 Tax=Phytophthora fragariae TaxID=53985 RepID=A0A6A3UM65_9STRA|nr:hypothetical protein PF009_g7074 [Phytophthora fragariae]KAE9125743.1 hypothetical protein PF010_g5524 [Phytophthora fragariae]KAE9152334.1 hypothetical protein PF006_g3441 [Phytophthora fragariae]